MTSRKEEKPGTGRKSDRLSEKFQQRGKHVQKLDHFLPVIRSPRRWGARKTADAAQRATGEQQARGKKISDIDRLSRQGF